MVQIVKTFNLYATYKLVRYRPLVTENIIAIQSK